MSLREIADIPLLPPREPESHKGVYGHVLVIGGSLGMTGAPALASEAALRTGSGLVTCACPGHLNPILEVKLTEAMTWPLPIDKEGCLGDGALRVLEGGAHRFDAVVLGPGLGRVPASIEFARRFLLECALPAVVDADALRAYGDEHRSRADLVLTPHPGEFGSMTGTSAGDVQADRRKASADFARANAGVLVLKGHRTVVIQRDAIYTNHTGNPGMASGGSGDVLSGIIGSLVGRGMAPFDAARLGVWLHGRAGDLAAGRVGEESLVAGDIIRFLPDAVRERKRGAGEGSGRS